MVVKIIVAILLLLLLCGGLWGLFNYDDGDY